MTQPRWLAECNAKRVILDDWWQEKGFKLGRRGRCLLILGTMWLVFAWASAFHPLPPEFKNREIIQWVPAPMLGAMWLICGVSAIIYAFRRKPGADAPGFVMATLPCALYATSCAVSTTAWALLLIFHIHLFPLEAEPLGNLAIFGSLAVLVRVIAGWPEQTPLVRRRRSGG